MASPAEIRRPLANSSLYLESLYYASRAQAAALGPNEVDNIIACYPSAVQEAFHGRQEDQIKRVITPTSLRQLRIRSQGEVLDLIGTDR